MKARDNPFAADRVLAVRYRLRDTTWDALLDRLAALRYRAAIVGPPGTGKTTLLEDLTAQLAARGHRVRSCRAPHLPPDVAGNEILCVDSAELLPWWRWAGRRWRGGLLVTRHRPGHLPTLHHCQTDAGLLDGILATLDPSLPVTQRAAWAAALHATHAGNVRAALRECYDRYANVRA